MKPLFPIVVALLVLAANAHPENIEDVKELPQGKEPVLEAEASEPQARTERCTACAGTNNLKFPKGHLGAIQALPVAELHTQESYEGCSSAKGCAGLKVKDGKIIEKFGNIQAFNAALGADTDNEFQFQAAGNSVFEGGVPNGGPFWWMNQNSPFKAGAAGNGGSFENFSKTSSSFSSSSNGGAGGVNLGANPFLNGDFSKLSQGAGFNDAGGNFASTQSFKSTTAKEIDISGNPFLNGGLTGQAGFGSSSQSAFGSNSQSGFGAQGGQTGFGAQSGQAGFGTQGGQSGFGAQGGQNAFGSAFNSNSKFGYTGSSPAPFATATGANVNLIQNSQKNNFDYEQQQQTQQNIDEIFKSTGNVNAHDNSGGDLQQTCAGQGYVCVHKAQCNNGVVNTNGAGLLQANTQKQYCNTRTEICCRIETSSLAGNTNLQGSLGVGSGTFHSNSNQGQGLFSQSGSSQGSQNSFGSTGFGTGFNANRGSSSTGFGSQFGSGSAFNSNKFGSTASGFGSTVTPTPTRFGANAGNFNNEVFKSTSQTNFVETDSFSAGSENAGVFRPGATGSGLKPGVPYLPPTDTSTSGSNVNVVSSVYTPAFVTTPVSRPFTTPGPVITPRPFTTPRPTYLPPVSTKAPEYLPPIDRITGSDSFQNPHYIDGQLILDETLPRPVSRPPPPQNIDIPSACAAALLCTPVEFCTADGIVSNTSVALTRDQQAYRVPLTDCRIADSGRIGKCCRDPFYTDPWPATQIGQWVPGVFGGNDGKYVPDSRGSSNNQPGVTVRPPVTGSVILNNFRTTNTPLGPTATPGYGQGSYSTGGQGSYTKGGQGQVQIQGQGQYGSAGQGFGTQIGQGSSFSQTSQGFGQGGGGTYTTGGQGTQVTQGGGQIIRQGFGTGVTQGQGQGVIQGGGVGVSRGQGFAVTGGAGQYTTQGSGFGVQQGGGFGVQQGGGFGVQQGGGYGIQQGQGQAIIRGQGQKLIQGQQGYQVENEFGESVQRVYLPRYSGSGDCGTQNPQKPFGNRKDLEVDFSQISWQAMILLKTNKTLLCGGVIVRPDVVLTSASCVERYTAKDVAIKGGEWKLGIDEEPLPFQIVQVQTILRHPFYKPGILTNDVAILVLGENLRLAKNILPICLPSLSDTLDGFYNGAGECIVTGWGKSVLQAHLQGAIMHSLNVSLINPGECQATISSNYPHLLENYDQATSVCGQPTNPANNICKVDTGSALACTNDGIHYVLRGIYSWESGCQTGNQLAAFFKFDLEWYEWAIGLGESTRFTQFTTVKQGQGQKVIYGQGQGIVQGIATGVKQGQGQKVIYGQGQKITQGVATGVSQGQGFSVSQNGGYQVENAFGESVQRLFLPRYSGSGDCGIQNPQRPFGNRKDLEVDFAEISWQAMILLKTNKTLLCGGVIVRPDVVITSASCLEGFTEKQIAIKGGEWKLAVEDEPLRNQIVQLRAILRHPFYKYGTYENDVAILVLANNLNLAQNILPICLPSLSDTLDGFYNGAGECVVTGWGKEVLRAGRQGAIMHGLNVSLINPRECQSKISSSYPYLLERYHQGTTVCGQPTNPANNICNVDTGSALACTNDGIHYVLRGIYSWESGCQTGNQLASFFKFDLEWYEWAIGLRESTRFTQSATKVTNKFGVSQGQGQKVIYGQGQGINQGIATGVTQGQGQKVIYGQGQGVIQGIGTGVSQGQGFSVSQNGGYQVENAFGESVQRLFLPRYSGSGDCGIQNPQRPFGNRKDLEVDFAEISWQAMILLKTNKTLLCGGVIVRPDVVITSASCLEGFTEKQIAIKGGEWKLAVEDEPLRNQIVQLRAILRHPFYNYGTYENDVAILVLANNLNLAQNILPICLPSLSDTLDGFYNGAGECVVTGWGKEVLRAGRQGAIMHGLNVSLINPRECQSKISSSYPYLLERYHQGTTVCGQPTNPANNICNVDTGSALACTNDGIHYVLRGIYSWESGCQTGNQLASFFKFDLEWYEWAIGLRESTRFTQSATKVTNKFGVSQGQGQKVIYGQGQGINQGIATGVTQGQGQKVIYGQGQGVIQGIGTGVSQGQGFSVSQNGGYQVENAFGESVQRLFLPRYSGSGDCGIQNPQRPFGNRKDLEVDFAEISWQAMILLKTNKTLLCGGVIVRPDVVITSASCLEGFTEKQIAIKGGEWKLAVEDEPLRNQIVQLRAILRHPFYNYGTYENDVAILVLANNLNLAQNILPICLPSLSDTLDGFYNGAGECVVTGWGKEVLRAGRQGAIMHGMNVSLINPGECQSKIASNYPHLLERYDQGSCVCGQPTNPANNICNVDTGSALACTNDGIHYVLRGIYSWESGCQTGNQLASFFKFDLEWYEWAIGLRESTRFSQSAITKYTKNKIIGQVSGTQGNFGSDIKGSYGVGFKGTGAGPVSSGATAISGSGATGFKGFGVQGQGQSGQFSQFGLGTSGSGIKGTAVSGSGVGAIKGFGVQGQGQAGQFSQFGIGSGGFGTEIKGPIQNTFSATYSENKFFQTEPKYVTYTTKPEIVTFTTKPEIVTFTTKPEYFTYTTKPKYVTYTTKPEIITYTTKPEIVTYTTKPEIITYTTKPKIVTYTTKPEFIRYDYQTSGSQTSQQVVAPSVSFNPSFTEVVGARHTHDSKCKCLEGKK